MKIFLLFTISLFIATSCAYHTGTFSSSSPCTRVVYEDVAMGVVTTSNFLGIGGTNRDGLIYEAKKNLNTNRPLNSNEEYLNFTIDFKRTNYLFVNRIKTTVTCDVVSRTNDTLKPIYSEKYKAKAFNSTNDIQLFVIGDSIIDQNLQKGIIVSILPNNKVLVLSKLSDNSETTSSYKLNNIFVLNKWFNGYKSGENFSFMDSFSKQTKSKKILGVGINAFIFREDGYPTKINYSKVKK